MLHLPHRNAKLELQYKNLSECEGRIDKFVPRFTVWHHEASRVMTNGDPEGRIFLSYPHTNNRLFFLLITVFLAHLSRRLMGELIVYQSLWHPSVVCQHFQTSSPLKPLGQLNSNFIWRLLRTREQKFVQMVLVKWPRWPPYPYMVKTFKRLLLQNQKTYELGIWYVALGVLGLLSLFKWWSQCPWPT